LGLVARRQGAPLTFGQLGGQPIEFVGPLLVTDAPAAKLPQFDPIEKLAGARTAISYSCGRQWFASDLKSSGSTGVGGNRRTELPGHHRASRATAAGTSALGRPVGKMNLDPTSPMLATHALDSVAGLRPTGFTFLSLARSRGHTTQPPRCLRWLSQLAFPLLCPASPIIWKPPALGSSIIKISSSWNIVKRNANQLTLF